jgi:hypothetical protein
MLLVTLLQRPRARRESVLASLLISVFVAVNAWNALHKGGDAEVFFDGGRRVLRVLPLYEGSSAASGFIGPPFQALFFVPFAAIDAVNHSAAKLTWYAVNVAALLAGIYFWSRAAATMVTASFRGRLDIGAAGLALLAVLLPIQTNFEHMNMNALLLGMLGAAAWSLVTQRFATGGALIGTAAALKAFPALVILYLVLARLRTAWVTAAVMVAALTLLPMLFYGATEFTSQLGSWLHISSDGWPLRGNNQSLFAAIDRLFTEGWTSSGISSTSQSPTAFMLTVVVGLALVMSAVISFGRRPTARLLIAELTAVIVLAVLLSPIAWDHYWTLLFPAFLLVYQASDRNLLGRQALYAFWTAAILTSGLSRTTLGQTGWSVARELSVDTIAALVLYFTLLRLCRVLRRASPGRDSDSMNPVTGSSLDRGLRPGPRLAGALCAPPVAPTRTEIS